MARHDLQAAHARPFLLAALVVSLSGCLASTEEPLSAPEIEDGRPSDLPVIQVLLGEFDGEELTFRPLDEREINALNEDARAAGVVTEALVDIPSMTCSTCTGANYVAFTTVAGSRRAITNGAAQGTVPLWTSADVANCGPIPTTGACQQVRLRNLFPSQLERVYAELIALMPTNVSTSVSVLPQPFSAANDFGLTADIPNGMWRFGEIGRSSPAGTGRTTWWSFVGTTPPGTEFTFRFVVQVRGLIVEATQRANLADGELDDPATDYPARTAGAAVASSSVAISADGRYVAFATSDPALTGTAGNFIVRKDLADGSIDLANATSCGTIAQPHLSGDGSVVVFQATGCNLTGLSTAATTLQVFAHDFATSTTTLVSRGATSGTYGRGASQNPRVSADGTAVVFDSTATDLVAGLSGRYGCREVYRYALATNTMIHVSALRGSSLAAPNTGLTAACTGRDEAGQTPDISGDGDIVVFATAQPLEASDTFVGRDIYVYDHSSTVGSGTVTVYRVSKTPSGGDSDAAALNFPAVSDNGAFITFASLATNIAGTTSNRRHVYRRGSAEAANASIELVTRRVDDVEVNGNTLGNPSISTSGRFVAFWSSARDLASDGSFRSPLGIFEVHVCDVDAPVAPLERCWIASAFQPTGASAFALLGGTTSVGADVRIGMSYPSDNDAGYVTYIATPDNWGSMNGTSSVFVSPIGDPRSQQADVRP